MTAYTDTYIIDLALGHLAEGPVMSENDPRPSVKFMRRHIDVVRDELLRGTAWNFAIRRTRLNAHATPPEFGFAYSYPLPSDWIRSLTPTESGQHDGQSFPHRIEGKALLCDQPPPLEYVYLGRPSDNSFFSADFVTTLAAGLAWRAANPVTGKAQFADWLFKVSAENLKKAREANAAEGTRERPTEANWVIDAALGHLLEPPAVEEGSTRSIVTLLRRQYPNVKRELLRGHPWNFAIRRKVLTAAATQPEFGWRYAYQLPTDWLRSLPPTYQGQFESDVIPHQIEGRTLVTDQAAPLRYVYVAEVEVDSFTADFGNALAATLASRYASSMPDRANMTPMLAAAAKDMVDRAKVLDGLEGSQARPESDSWINARFTGLQPDQRWYRSRNQE